MVIRTNFDPIAKSYPAFASLKTANNSDKSKQLYYPQGVTTTDVFQKSSVTSRDDILAVFYPELYAKKHITPEVIKKAISTNPKIKDILAEHDLPLKFNMENATGIINSHLVPVSECARKIYKRMGHTKEEPLYPILAQAALLHDVGKVFIPHEILYTRGKLTDDERKIIELHNLLSYEILDTTGVSRDVARLALKHHDYGNYGNYGKEEADSIKELIQVLRTADIYSALREERSYKAPLDHSFALDVMSEMASEGKLEPDYIEYLK